MLWDPAAHEPLLQEAWNEDRVRAAIRAIAADAEDVFDGGWRIHPRNRDPNDPELWSGTYLGGGAGVVDALCRLAERGLVELQRDYLEHHVAGRGARRRPGARGRRADVAGRAGRKGRGALSRHGRGTATRFSRCSSGQATTSGSSELVASRFTRSRRSSGLEA